MKITVGIQILMELGSPKMRLITNRLLIRGIIIKEVIMVRGVHLGKILIVIHNLKIINGKTIIIVGEAITTGTGETITVVGEAILTIIGPLIQIIKQINGVVK